jgi:hypothetical protein
MITVQVHMLGDGCYIAVVYVDGLPTKHSARIDNLVDAVRIANTMKCLYDVKRRKVS